MCNMRKECCEFLFLYVFVVNYVKVVFEFVDCSKEVIVGWEIFCVGYVIVVGVWVIMFVVNSFLMIML